MEEKALGFLVEKLASEGFRFDFLLSGSLILLNFIWSALMSREL